ncbi:MAG: acyl-CoA dehydrogenase, partial [Syntrophales bacterium]|nr:acyl-CoA dehydrogenase [Syntrophales bacterium]
DQAPEGVQRRYAQPLARGQITASLAISEPGVGPHPKHLTTTADPHNGHFVINGEKSYLTNGPIAAVFAVLAITAQQGARKRYSIFLVPRKTEGLHLTAGVPITFLRPSPHGGLRLENCTVPAENMIGNEGEAYEQTAIPFRNREDVALMGPLLGGMAVQTNLVVQALREAGATGTDAVREELGAQVYLLDALRVLAYEAATVMDRRGKGADVTSLVLAFRALAKRRLMRCRRLMDTVGLKGTKPLTIITEDLRRTVGIAAQVMTLKQRKLGDKLWT